MCFLHGALWGVRFTLSCTATQRSCLLPHKSGLPGSLGIGIGGNTGIAPHIPPSPKHFAKSPKEASSQTSLLVKSCYFCWMLLDGVLRAWGALFHAKLPKGTAYPLKSLACQDPRALALGVPKALHLPSPSSPKHLAKLPKRAVL